MKRVVLLITMLTVAATSSWAQNGEIVYHKDITPKEMRADDPWPGNIRQFDFDEDSMPDFFIAWAEYREWHVIAYTYGSWWFERQILEPGDTIATIPSWFPEPEDPDYGPEISFDSGFSRDSIIIGIKNQVGDGEFCYGWIRFSLDAGPERLLELSSGNRVPWAHGVCTFLDYAYCTQPNYPLRAGQTSYSASVNENAPDAFVTVLPNPTNGMATIMGENLQQAEVFNMLGQKLLGVKGKGDELHIDMAALPTGVYFVTVTDEEGRKCVRKVMKE